MHSPSTFWSPSIIPSWCHLSACRSIAYHHLTVALMYTHCKLPGRHMITACLVVFSVVLRHLPATTVLRYFCSLPCPATHCVSSAGCVPRARQLPPVRHIVLQLPVSHPLAVCHQLTAPTLQSLCGIHSPHRWCIVLANFGVDVCHPLTLLVVCSPRWHYGHLIPSAPYAVSVPFLSAFPSYRSIPSPRR